MPEDTQKQEIAERIDEVLAMVDLKEHEGTYIRKLSGGQKKRASIAVELLADPKLFFLDEPTSGLDPGTEKNLMMTLSALFKEQNKTIIMVTHTTQNLHLCDKVIFRGPGGRLCFCGDVNAAKAFYETDDLVNIYNMIAENPWLWERRYAAYRKDKEAAPAPAGSASAAAAPHRGPAQRGGGEEYIQNIRKHQVNAVCAEMLGYLDRAVQLYPGDLQGTGHTEAGIYGEPQAARLCDVQVRAAGGAWLCAGAHSDPGILKAGRKGTGRNLPVAVRA